MSREKAICTLEQFIKSEQFIKRMGFAQGDPQVYPKWEDQHFIDDTLQEAKNLLERIEAGDDGAIQEGFDLLENE